MATVKQRVEEAVELTPEPTAPAPVNGRSGTIPARRLTMDEYTLFVNGEQYHPRVGEWLEVPHSRTIREARELEDQLRVQEGESPEDYNARLWRTIVEGGYILGWNLKSLSTGRPLLPATDLDAYLDLTNNEFGYVTGRIVIGWRDLPPFNPGSEPTPTG